MVVLALAVLGVYLTFRASLPRLDGDTVLPGLRAVATIERDANGVPTVRASNRRDLARATGYLHAQDRFFQMDLQRRLAAGELSELLGPATVPTDRSLRRHQFTRVADQVLGQATPAERDLLDAYAEGVNQALSDLGARPWEYLPLGATPRAWKARDSLLVAFAMYIDLNDTTGNESWRTLRLQPRSHPNSSRCSIRSARNGMRPSTVEPGEHLHSRALRCSIFGRTPPVSLHARHSRGKR